MPASKLGLFGAAASEAEQLWSMLKGAPSAFTVAPSGADHGVISLVTLAVSQAIPVFSGAPLPLKNSRFRSSKGSCGVSLTVAVSWPVFGSASIRPGSLTTTPDFGSLTVM